MAAAVRTLGEPAEVWSALATVAAQDLSIARALEPHIDALTILAEARSPIIEYADRYRWGVYAAEGGDTPLRARFDGDGWRLTGVKPWCSLARVLDRALVTAWTSKDSRGLFAVDLTDPRISIGAEPWVARGLPTVDSPSITCGDVAAIPVGDEGWYFDRPGFGAGGIRVAAVWFGGAVGVARTMRTAAAARVDLDQIGRMHLGSVDAALHRARCVLADAGRRLSAATGDEAWVIALHVRNAVRQAAEEVLERAAHALGPAPLVRDAAHAARVADLTVYLRQEHAERDAVTIGDAVRSGRGLVL